MGYRSAHSVRPSSRNMTSERAILARGSRHRCVGSQRPVTFSPMPPRIETERLILTPEEPGDAEWFTELLNARGTGTFTVADTLERIDVMTKTIETTGIGALVLRKRPDGEALGYTAIVVGRGSLDEPEHAYKVLPRAHGHGYATEAARRRIRYRPASNLGDNWVLERTVASGGGEACGCRILVRAC
jgi:hypothetical protein